MNKYKLKSGFNIKYLIIVCSMVLLVCYGFFNARNLIMGPSIQIFTPSEESETDQNLVSIKGKVKNMTYLSLNERPVYADKNGYFEEKVLLSPGFNILEFKIRDRFKEEVKKTIKVYYKESSSTPLTKYE